MSPTGFANLDGARAIATAAARMHSMDIFDFEATDFSADDANGLASTDTLPTSPFVLMVSILSAPPPAMIQSSWTSLSRARGRQLSKFCGLLFNPSQCFSGVVRMCMFHVTLLILLKIWREAESAEAGFAIERH